MTGLPTTREEAIADLVRAERAGFDLGFDAGLRRAAEIARESRQREIDLHLLPFDQLPEANQFFVLGSERAAADILAECSGGSKP